MNHSNCEPEGQKRKPKLIVWLILAALIVGAAVFFKSSGLATDFVWRISNGGKWLLPLVGVSALVDSINPCAFSVLLLTIAILFGIGGLRSNILKAGLAYIAGLFLVYLLIGLGIFHALHIFNTPHFMGKLAAAFLIGLGAINILGEVFPNFPIKLRIPNSAHHKMAVLMEKASLPAVFALGGLVGLCEFPCTGGPYLMVLGLLHDAATYLKGVGYLILYNLIFVSPLIVILFIASNKSLLGRVRAWQEKKRGSMRLYGGLAMVVLGIIILLI